MLRRVILFFVIFAGMVSMPIILFPRSASLEDAQFQLAVQLYNSDRYMEAITEFNRLLDEMRTEKYADACRYYTGLAWFALESYDSAKAAFNKVVEEHGKSVYRASSIYHSARIEYIQKNYSGAITLFDLYVRQYPADDYADNSLYWKAESLLDTGRRESAKAVFIELLKRYPLGNKADAARYKLRLLELEEKVAEREPETGVPETPSAEASAVNAETAQRLEQQIAENEKLREREKGYLDEILKLNNQIEYLQSELNNVKALAGKTSREQQRQMEERIKTLTAWENLLTVKENALKQKEEQLNRMYEELEETGEEEE